jgi:hypothetical protein
VMLHVAKGEGSGVPCYLGSIAKVGCDGRNCLAKNQVSYVCWRFAT